MTPMDVQSLREQAGWSLEALARALGVALERLESIEAGDLPLPASTPSGQLLCLVCAHEPLGARFRGEALERTRAAARRGADPSHVRLLRDKLGWCAEELARALGVTCAHLERLERGERRAGAPLARLLWVYRRDLAIPRAVARHQTMAHMLFTETNSTPPAERLRVYLAADSHEAVRPWALFYGLECWANTSHQEMP